MRINSFLDFKISNEFNDFIKLIVDNQRINLFIYKN